MSKKLAKEEQNIRFEFKVGSTISRLGVNQAYPHRTTNVTANSSGQSLIQIPLGIPRKRFSSVTGTGRLHKGVKVDSVCNASGCVEEGLHEIFESKLLGLGDLQRLQLFLAGFLAVHSDQR